MSSRKAAGAAVFLGTKPGYVTLSPVQWPLPKWGLEWDAVPSENLIDGYRIERDAGQGWVWESSVSPGTLEWKFPDYPPGTYSFRVSSTRGEENSPPSNEVSATFVKMYPFKIGVQFKTGTSDWETVIEVPLKIGSDNLQIRPIFLPPDP